MQHRRSPQGSNVRLMWPFALAGRQLPPGSEWIRANLIGPLDLVSD